jgi:redox-sensing transcriptional repressor
MTAPVGAGSKTALDGLLMQQMTKLRRILQNAGRRPAHPGSLLCLRTLKSTINKKLLQNWQARATLHILYLIQRRTCVERSELPPDVVIRRLPLYARSLRYLLEEGVHSVSSQELGERINVTAAQIRKDLSYFGEFGKQGIGYDVEKLLQHIERILGINQHWPVALVGIGLLGQAIARYEGFRTEGIEIVALFDADPAKIGQKIGDLTIQDFAHARRVIAEKQIRMAIIAVPAAQAQRVADVLVEAGVRAILSYAPMILQVPEDVWVRYIDPVAVLQSMTYYLAREQQH